MEPKQGSLNGRTTWQEWYPIAEVLSREASLSVGLLPELPPSEPPGGQSVRKWVGVSKLSLPGPGEEGRRVRGVLKGQMRDKRMQIGCTVKTRKCRKIEWNFKRPTG